MRIVNSLISVLSASLISTSCFADSALMASASRPIDLSNPFRIISEDAAMLEGVREYSKKLGLSVPFTLQPVAEQVGIGMRTIKSQLSVQGVPVHGGILSAHRTNQGSVSFSGSVPKSVLPDLEPRISQRQALAIASLHSSNPLAEAPRLTLVENSERSKVDLVWWVDFRSTSATQPGVDVMINAETGSVMGSISKMDSADIEVYNARESGLLMELLFAKTGPEGQKLSMRSKARIKALRRSNWTLDPAQLRKEPEVIGCNIKDIRTGKEARNASLEICTATMEGRNDFGKTACQIINATPGSDGAFMKVIPENCERYSVDDHVVGPADPSASQAQENSRNVYDYYSDRFGRRSFDGKGTVLRSVVKAGIRWNNAAWMGDLNFMVYGAGDGKEMGDFTQLLDVAGHEMTHGVVNATAKLTMRDEPGALNEATADYFGLQISRYNDWIIGKGLYLKRPEEGLRSLWNPAMYSDTYLDPATGARVKKPNPEKYSERYRLPPGGTCDGSNDRCFVHMNSTIMSHGYYWIHRALGKHKTQDLLFLALTQYYTPNTNFHEAANHIRRACSTMLSATDCDLVSQALQKVEL